MKLTTCALTLLLALSTGCSDDTSSATTAVDDSDAGDTSQMSDTAGDASSGVLEVEVKQKTEANGRAYAEVLVRNASSDPLTLFESPRLTQTDSASIVQRSENSFPLKLEAFGSDELRLKVQGNDVTCGEFTATLRVVSDDTRGTPLDSGRFEHRVDLTWNQDGPTLTPDGRFFGKVALGSMSRRSLSVLNCGEEPIVIDDIELVSDTTGEFELANLGTAGIEAGETSIFDVLYSPVNDVRGEVDVRVDVSDYDLTETLFGEGYDGECIEASAVVYAQGDSSARATNIIGAAVGDTLVIDASESAAEYLWRLDWIPPGFSGDLVIDPAAPGRAELTVAEPGTYKVRVQIMDDEGVVSCTDAGVEIQVRKDAPEGGLLIELMWHNEEDPDETDDNGSDVDLHFVKMGPGKWFEAPYDIYFRNQNHAPNDGSSMEPIWGIENPSLFIDTREGAGPEIIALDRGASCVWYAVGVHYFAQRFGTAEATLRVVDRDGLVYESNPKAALTTGDQFWDALRIHWDGTKFSVLTVGSDPEIVGEAPAEEEPTVTEKMELSGLCTADNLY